MFSFNVWTCYLLRIPPCTSSNYSLPTHISSPKIISGKTKFCVVNIAQYKWSNKADTLIPCFLSQNRRHYCLPNQMYLFYKLQSKPRTLFQKSTLVVMCAFFTISVESISQCLCFLLQTSFCSHLL